MTSKEIINEIKSLENPSVKKIFLKHGAQEPFYGVKVEELKKIQKKVKMNYALSLELFDSGISDAMYLAGLISDPQKMSKKELHQWAENATWYMIGEYAVAWTAAESKHGWELALEWIESDIEKIACAGWCTLSCFVSLTHDENLDIKKLKLLLSRVEKTIHASPNRVRYTMNGFVISCGGYVAELTTLCIQIAKNIGTVKVNMGDTACKVPSAAEYILKMKARGNLGKKKKTVKC